MAVIINELEHVPTPPDSRARGDGSGGGGSGGGSSAPSPNELIQALRRETARRARLWAD